MLKYINITKLLRFRTTTNLGCFLLLSSFITCKNENCLNYIERTNSIEKELKTPEKVVSLIKLLQDSNVDDFEKIISNTINKTPENQRKKILLEKSNSNETVLHFLFKVKKFQTSLLQQIANYAPEIITIKDSRENSLLDELIKHEENVTEANLSILLSKIDADTQLKDGDFLIHKLINYSEGPGRNEALKFLMSKSHKQLTMTGGEGKTPYEMLVNDKKLTDGLVAIRAIRQLVLKDIFDDNNFGKLSDQIFPYVTNKDPYYFIGENKLAKDNLLETLISVHNGTIVSQSALKLVKQKPSTESLEKLYDTYFPLVRTQLAKKMKTEKDKPFPVMKATATAVDAKDNLDEYVNLITSPKSQEDFFTALKEEALANGMKLDRPINYIPLIQQKIDPAIRSLIKSKPSIENDKLVTDTIKNLSPGGISDEISEQFFNSASTLLAYDFMDEKTRDDCISFLVQKIETVPPASVLSVVDKYESKKKAYPFIRIIMEVIKTDTFEAQRIYLSSASDLVKGIGYDLRHTLSLANKAKTQGLSKLLNDTALDEIDLTDWVFIGLALNIPNEKPLALRKNRKVDKMGLIAPSWLDIANYLSEKRDYKNAKELIKEYEKDAALKQEILDNIKTAKKNNITIKEVRSEH